MAAFTVNVNDLNFILRQIKISEAHAAGTPLTEVYVDANGNVVAAGTPGAFLAIPDPHVPNGLRTVDGTFNNLIGGREQWGAADTVMPRLLDPTFQNDLDWDTMPLGPGNTVTYTGAPAQGVLGSAGRQGGTGAGALGLGAAGAQATGV